MNGVRDWQPVWITENNRDLLNRVAPAVFDEPIKRGYLTAYLANPFNWLAVVQAEGAVVGMLMATVLQTPDKGAELFLNEIGTGSDWRRQGIAEALMQALFARADEEGLEEIWVGTELDNRPARALYEKHGREFEPSIFYYLDW